MKFITRLVQRIEQVDSLVCVGLDSRWDRLPEDVIRGMRVDQAVLAFNQRVVEATCEYSAAYKMNVAFYSGFGVDGLAALAGTNEYIHTHHPDMVTIADCKRSEMGESVVMVKQEIFDWLGFDALIVTPWFGKDTIQGYLEDETKGVSVFVHDSNQTAVEFQELELKDGRRVYEVVAEHLVGWNTNGNVFAEAAATYPEALKRVREIIGSEMVILTAGIGAQGGKVADLPKGVFGANNQRLLVNSSRGIIFAGEGKADYFGAVGEAAKKLRDELREV